MIMAGKDDNFKVLKKKEIYEFLEGNGPSLVTHNGTEYGLPYYTTTQLSSLCTEFGLTDVVGGSRWCYVEELLDYAIEQQRCDELFRFLFSEKQFTNLQDMYVENASRATGEGSITVNNLEPNPKNPIIASFFRNIGYADQLESGVRNLFKYSRYYSGQEPEFVEGDIFKIIVPLNDEYSYDFETNGIETDNADKVQKSADKIRDSADKVQDSADKTQESADKLLAQYKLILDYTEKNGKITSRQVEELLNVKQRRAREVLSKMVDKGTLVKQGAYKSTVYMINQI